MNKEQLRILSLIFHRPDKEFAAYLRTAFWKDVELLGPGAAGAFATFLEENRGKSDEDFYYALAAEHTRLFVNAVPKVPCPPYESVWREKVAMGASTMEVLDSYRRAGLDVLGNFRDLPDHLAVELEFLYFLLSTGKTDDYESFVKQHLSQWVPEFCDKVEEHDRLGFYRVAAAALREFIAEEERQLLNLSS